MARWSKVLDTVATLSFQESDVTYAAFLEVLELQARRTDLCSRVQRCADTNTGAA